MRLSKATEQIVYLVALQMREPDYREILPLTSCHGREDLARYMALLYTRPDVLVASTDGGVPVAVGGLLEVRPGVYSSLMYATDTFPHIAKPLSKFLRNQLMPALKANGAHRFDAVSSVDHHAAHKWIEWMGYTKEGPPIRGLGRGGEPYQTYAWVADSCP